MGQPLPWRCKGGPAPHGRIMADVGAESMGGGTILFRRKMIQREISRALVLNLSGKASGARHCLGYFLSLTAPSLLSRGTPRPIEIQECHYIIQSIRRARM